MAGLWGCNQGDGLEGEIGIDVGVGFWAAVTRVSEAMLDMLPPVADGVVWTHLSTAMLNQYAIYSRTNVYLYAIYMTCGMDCRVRMANTAPAADSLRA